jgi:hypothetical protein
VNLYPAGPDQYYTVNLLLVVGLQVLIMFRHSLLTSCSIKVIISRRAYRVFMSVLPGTIRSPYTTAIPSRIMLFIPHPRMNGSETAQFERMYVV